MLRKTLSAILLIAATASAQNRGRVAGPIPAPVPGITITGSVTAVNGTKVSLADGLVTIDVAHATITNDRGTFFPNITPGSLIFAILRPGTPLQASSVVVSNPPQVTLTGTVESVDAAARTFNILGLTIQVDGNTSFGGSHDVRSIADIVAGDVVQVQANAQTEFLGHGSHLVASSILVFAPLPQLPTMIHGTVKNIAIDAWIITDSRRGDLTVTVNAQTKILGSPKVGDTVDVLANIDSANNYVAISIMVSPSQMHISGVVKSIGTTFWVIGPAAGLGPDFLVQVNAQTRIVGDPKVGDRVDVVVQAGRDGFVAISITKV